jgi:hypothetical protein
LVLSALEPFPPANGWETPVFFQGHDSYWYFRELCRGADEESGISGYFRTVDISLQGEKISAASFLEAAEPAGPEKAPPLLALVLEEAARLAGRTCTVAVVSPEFPCRRLYRAGGGEPSPGGADSGFSEEPEFAGYYRPAAGSGEGLAIVVLPDGRGVYGISGGGPVRDGHFRLPALPTGEGGIFSYTGIALAGDLLVAAWEEQAAWNVGAAGFLLLEINL